MGNWFYWTSCKDTFYDKKKQRLFLKKNKKTLLLKANSNQTWMIENDQITSPVIQLWISRSKNNDWKDIKPIKMIISFSKVPYWVFIFL